MTYYYYVSTQKLVIAWQIYYVSPICSVSNLYCLIMQDNHS